MPNTEQRYRALAEGALALAPGAEIALPFARKGSSFLFPLPEGTPPLPREAAVELPAKVSLASPFAALYPYCRAKVSRGGGWLLLDALRAEDLPALMAERGWISPPLRHRLEAFLAIRPLYQPKLHPGLGLLIWEDRLLIPVPRLLEGWGGALQGFHWPTAFNLELTTQCPLRCPQCYVHLRAGQHMPLEIAKKWIAQAAELGAASVDLSGGETMCYPWLYEVIAYAREQGIAPEVALSGYGIDDESLDRLISAGVHGIFVSLNGPTEAVNAHTRDGYALAVRLLEKLRDRAWPETHINWVVHDSNVSCFPEMLALAERYKVRAIAVMAFKPDSRNALPSLPSAEQMRELARQIRAYEGPVEIEIESCYSSLRSLVGQSFYGNRNIGAFRGCGAGKDAFSVALDGRLTPCRHLDIREAWDSLEDYWQRSLTIQALRRAAVEDPGAPCGGCRLREACRHCMAVNWKLNGALRRGDETCPLGSCMQEVDAHV